MGTIPPCTKYNTSLNILPMYSVDGDLKGVTSDWCWYSMNANTSKSAFQCYSFHYLMSTSQLFYYHFTSVKQQCCFNTSQYITYFQIILIFQALYQIKQVYIVARISVNSHSLRQHLAIEKVFIHCTHVHLWLLLRRGKCLAVRNFHLK